MNFRPAIFVTVFSLAAVLARAAEPWAQLRSGMGEAQVQQLVGLPLVASSGHGYLHWCFDREGEVMFYGGTLLYWTVPRSSEGATPIATLSHVVDHPTSEPTVAVGKKVPAGTR